MKQNEILNYFHTCSTMLFALFAWTGAFQVPELNPGQHGAKLLFSLGLTSKSISFCTAPVPWMWGVSCGAEADGSTANSTRQGAWQGGERPCWKCHVHTGHHSQPKIINTVIGAEAASPKALLRSPLWMQQSKIPCKGTSEETKQPGSLQNRCKRGKCSS